MAETILKHAGEFETDFIMYTSTFCPYCTAAKRLFKQKNLSFTEFNFDHEPELRSLIVQETGHRTVPVIIDNRGNQPMFIGGFDETNRYLNK
ncbi:MAG: glutaredoxin 3 [Euryarchaeota archaeon]|nr:glutaredoxin 3 [Euryarchaeota archaeon]|tara:strand:+ start:9764 stop:10039 length:276 start_codon:yes stop_codon:yes gene_type:complete